MILELCRDPMVLVEDGRLSCLNAAARTAFYPAKAGDPAETLLPGELLERGAENAAFYGRVGESDYSVRCARAGAGRLYALREESRENDLLSDGVLSRLLSELFNLRVGTDRLLEIEPPDRNTMLWRLTARRSIFALDRLLGNLRLAKSLRDGVYPFRPKTVELGGYCADLVDIVRSVTDGSGVILRLEAEPRELPILADDELLERTLLNLLSNAFAVTQQGGVIRLSLNPTGKGVRISVSDSGGGIRPEVLDSVFHRASLSATPDDLRPAQTAGLGLFIVSHAVRLLGGTMMIENRPGEGAAVHVSLPLSAKPLELEAPREAPRPSAELARTELVDFTPLEGFSDLFWD